MTHSGITRAATALAAIGLVLAAIVGPSVALAATGPGHATTICHATTSDASARCLPTVDSDGPSSLDAAPSEDPLPSPQPSQSFDPSIPGDGEVSIDGPFITPTPSTTPDGAVLGATGTPGLTPPPTDLAGHGQSATGAGLPLLLLALAGLSSLALIVGRVPAARRS